MVETNLKQSDKYSVSELRPARLNIRVSDAEKRKFEKMAKERHTDISELVRQILHREADTKTAKA